MNSLEIVVTRSGRRGRQREVRLLVDGADRLVVDDIGTGNTPDDILDSGALVPTDPPRRIAFYGCGCGIFGCGNVAGLVVDLGDRIEWRDFVCVTGGYDSALPEGGDDPAVFEDEEDTDIYVRRLDLPTFTFDADSYRAVVASATADRSWESHELDRADAPWRDARRIRWFRR